MFQCRCTISGSFSPCLRHSCHLKTLEKLHQRCLRILCIRWGNCRTKPNIVMEASTTTVKAIVMQNQLRWAGQPSPRQVLFALLTHVMRTHGGGQRKRFENTVKHFMKKGQLNINTWEVMAADRSRWRHSIQEAMAKFEKNRLRHEAEKRAEVKGEGDVSMVHRLNIFMSAFYQPSSAHTATRSADQESGS